MKLAIIGTRGIPNNYGGFEQFAEYLSVGLVANGHHVTVYNSSTHTYKLSEWNGVRIIHCFDPENKWGTVGQFIYDFNCIKHARTQEYDIILQLGYTSSSIWSWLFPSKSVIITNMDGLEWKRTKFSKPVQNFLLKAESWAAKYSDFLVADSVGIQQYLLKKYSRPSTYIPYGANVFTDCNFNILQDYDLKAYKYNMLVARLEPENSIDIILAGVSKSTSSLPFLVVGKHNTEYGLYLKDKYKNFKNILFVGGIYNISILNNLRFYSNLYFHGHTVGGTNPSLLEAMASSSLVCAHDNIFNNAILGKDALYFTDSESVTNLVDNFFKDKFSSFIDNNINKIKTLYDWSIIISQYEKLFYESIK